MLAVDKGDVEDAAESIAGALRSMKATAGSRSTDVLARGRLLPAQVEIALAAGDIPTAQSAVAELEQIAEIYESPTWEASMLTCRASVDLQEGNPEKAIELLNRAWRVWQDMDLPYESARARLLLGQARMALGDHGAAKLEFRAARSTFQHLGASIDLRRLAELAGEEGADRDGVDRRRMTKVFMFTDIVTSTDLLGVIGDSAWEDLLEWHDRVLRETFAHHGGEEVRRTGDGFFVTFDSPRASIECAVAVQRRLEQHRREQGFSPWVRIGMHIAEATRQGGDYSGKGVHAAARVAALADREEIVVSSDLLDAVGTMPFPTSEARTVTLKGITEPMQIHTVDWR
jgi:class 3 adenylate cyclase